MRDIVSTIQAEQDADDPAALAGVVVIEGGPGTGKTAVALHRVAYLLYTHREQLARRGVLVVGPSPAVPATTSGSVLPSLGEIGRRVHHARRAPPRASTPTAVEAPEVAAAQGRAASMCAVLARGGRAPAAALPADRSDRRSTPSCVEVDRDGRDAAPRRGPRATGQPHNAARTVFARGPLRAAGRAQASTDHRRGARRPASTATWTGGRAATTPRPGGSAAPSPRPGRRPARRAGRPPGLPRRARRAVAAAARPSSSSRDLLRSTDRLAAARPAATAADRAPGRAAAPALTARAWTRRRRAAARRGSPSCSATARGRGRRPRGRRGCAAELVLRRRACIDRASTGGGRATRSCCGHRPRRRRAARRAARDAADRHVGRAGRRRPRVDLRARDRRRGAGALGRWPGGCWRAAAPPVDDRGRRPRADAATPRARARGPRCSRRTGDRCSSAQLTVNYRTPAEIMEAAALALPARPSATWCRVGAPHRRSAPIAPARLVDEVRPRPPSSGRGHGRAVISGRPGGPARPSTASVAHSPGSAKGLEFDVVAVVDPDAIGAACPADLYVAMTRATRRLVLVPGAQSSSASSRGRAAGAVGLHRPVVDGPVDLARRSRRRAAPGRRRRSPSAARPGTAPSRCGTWTCCSKWWPSGK